MTTAGAGDRRTPTVSDVATRAGVSRKTVYRALNDEGNVRPDKVERVRRVAAELGFRPDHFARLLRTRGTTSMVGVVTATVGDPFWTGVLQGVEAAIGGGDRFILSASTRDRSDRESEIVAAMVERRVMALIVVPTAVDQSIDETRFARLSCRVHLWPRPKPQCRALGRESHRVSMRWRRKRSSRASAGLFRSAE